MDHNLCQSTKDMLYLTAVTLHDASPEKDKVMKMNLQEVYQEAKRHTMTSCVSMALEKSDLLLEKALDVEIFKKFKDEKEKAIRKNILLDTELQNLQLYMEKKGIWYMPLKGSVLKELYPKYGMRQMSDVDVLYDGRFWRDICAYMQAHGYEVKQVGKGIHDVYLKEPVYNFEMHRELFGEARSATLYKYYAHIKEKLIKDENNMYGYYFSDEDFYIYSIAHAFKHYKAGGTGLRSLMDCYVYVKKKEKELDWDYIEKELKKIGVFDFEQKIRLLSVKLFSEPQHFYEDTFSNEQVEMLIYLSQSGTYGNLKNEIENKLEGLQTTDGKVRKITLWKYYINRLFPDMGWYQLHYPFCYRHKWAIPFSFIYRLGRGIMFRRKKIKKEFQIIQTIKEEKKYED